MKLTILIALLIGGCVTINECPRETAEIPILDLSQKYEVGDTRPAGDGCNTCTYYGGETWFCTLLSCHGEW